MLESLMGGQKHLRHISTILRDKGQIETILRDMGDMRTILRDMDGGLEGMPESIIL